MVLAVPFPTGHRTFSLTPQVRSRYVSQLCEECSPNTVRLDRLPFDRIPRFRRNSGYHTIECVTTSTDEQYGTVPKTGFRSPDIIDSIFIGTILVISKVYDRSNRKPRFSEGRSNDDEHATAVAPERCRSTFRASHVRRNGVYDAYKRRRQHFQWRL